MKKLISTAIISAAFIALPLGEAFADSSLTGQTIAENAKIFEGCNYSYGGASPATGFDCSGFVSYVYSSFNVDVGRTASDQMDEGTSVDYSEASPGDIVVFEKDGEVTHSGIYIGDGLFIHALNEDTGVVITEVDEFNADNTTVIRVTDE